MSRRHFQIQYVKRSNPMFKIIILKQTFAVMSRSLPAELGFVRSGVRVRPTQSIAKSNPSNPPDSLKPPPSTMPKAPPDAPKLIPSPSVENSTFDFRTAFATQMEKVKQAQEAKDVEVSDRLDKLSLLCSNLENMQSKQIKALESLRQDYSSISQNSGGHLIDRVNSLNDYIKMLETSFTSFSSKLEREIEDTKRSFKSDQESTNHKEELEKIYKMIERLDKPQNVNENNFADLLKYSFKMEAVCLVENMGRMPGERVTLSHPITTSEDTTYMQTIKRGADAEISIEPFPVENSSGPLVKFID